MTLLVHPRVKNRYFELDWIPSTKYLVTIFCLSSALSTLFILFCFAFINPF